MNADPWARTLAALAAPSTVLFLAVDHRFEASSDDYVLPVLSSFLSALEAGWTPPRG